MKPINVSVTADTKGIKDATKDLQANAEAATKAGERIKQVAERYKNWEAAHAAKLAAANPPPKQAPAKKSTSKSKGGSKKTSKSKSKPAPASPPKPKPTPEPKPEPAAKPTPPPAAAPKSMPVPMLKPAAPVAKPPAAAPSPTAPTSAPTLGLPSRTPDVAQPKVPGKMVSERLGKGAAMAAAGLKHLGTVAGKFLPPPMEILLKLTDQLAAGFMRWYENNQRLKGSVESFTETLEKAVTGGIDRFMDGIGDMLGEGDLVADLLDDITVALGGETAAMKELNKPLSMYGEAMKEARTEQEKFNDALEDERDLLDDVKSALEDQLALHEAKIETAEVAAELDADKARKAVEASGDDSRSKSSKLHKIDTDLELKKYDLRTQKRGAELQAQQLELTEREKSLKEADGAVAGQKDRVKRATDLFDANRLLEALKVKNKGANLEAGSDAANEWNSALVRQSKALKNAKGLGTADAEREKLQQMEKNAELQKGKVEDLQKDMERKSRRIAEEQKQDDMKTERALEDISSEHGQKHQAGLLGAKREPLVAPMEPVKLPPPPPPPPPVTEIPKGQLTPENQATNAGRMALKDALNDGKGNTNAEMAVVNQFDQIVREGKASRDAALLQALHAMRELQQGGSQMEMQLTSVLNTYGSKLSQMASTLNQLESRTSNIELNSKR